MWWTDPDLMPFAAPTNDTGMLAAPIQPLKHAELDGLRSSLRRCQLCTTQAVSTKLRPSVG